MPDLPRILVVGSVNMDLMMYLHAAPGPGETVLGDRYGHSAGGKGANQAAAAARLGAATAFAGKVGRDANGDRLRAGLAAQGVDVGRLLTDEAEPTGLAVIMVESDGQNRIVVYPGANQRLTVRDVTAAFDAVRPGAMIIQFEIPEETIIGCCREAVSRGALAVVDAGPARPFPLESLRGVDIISPNEPETLALTGIAPETDEGARAAARALKARTDARFVIIKRGARGAYVYDGASVDVNLPAYPVRAVDTTGAGDAFMAAVTYKFLETRDILEAVRYGNRVGAVTVTRPGAQPSMPTAAEVERFFENMR